MLKIILYKNCILNETYNNVFSTGNKNGRTSVLEKYLKTLESKIIEIDNTYQVNKGMLVFDYEFDMQNIYEYNYMKIETIEDNKPKIIRYCFIDNIELSNDIVRLEYKEDIRSSYSNKINGTTECYLDSLRYINYENNFIDIYNLKRNYESNNELLIEPLYNLNLTNTGCRIIVQVQFYDTQQYGESNIRNVKFFRLANNDENYFYDMKSITNILNILINNSGKQVFQSSNKKYFYEITNIYAIPLAITLDTEPTYFYTINYNDGIHTEDKELRFYELKEKENYDSYTIENNFKNVCFGTLSTQINITNNGSDNKFIIKTIASSYILKILLMFENKIIEITSDFSIEVPFTQANGEILAQQKIARELKNNILTYSSVQSSIDLATEPIKFLGSMVTSSINPYRVGETITDFGSFVNNETKSIGTLLENADKRNAINSPVYSSSKGTKVSKEGIANGLAGLLLFKIKSDNENFVKNYINNYGYNVYKFIENLDDLKILDDYYFYNKNINYNVYKFSTINVYGSFHRQIAVMLNTILESGVKVWYNEKMEKDNYMVG